MHSKNINRHTKSEFVPPSDHNSNRECLFIAKYIDEHFSEDITLDSLSSLTYMDKYYILPSPIFHRSSARNWK